MAESVAKKARVEEESKTSGIAMFSLEGKVIAVTGGYGVLGT